MGNMRFDIPEYDSAIINLIEQVIEGFLALDPLLGAIPKAESQHRGPIRNVRGDSPLDQNMPPIQSRVEIKLDTIHNTNFDDYTQLLCDIAQSNIAGLAQRFFKGMEEITSATGNTVNAAGKPFSFDLFNDLLEKVSIEFDKSGKPIFPTLVVPPAAYEKIKNLEPTPEQSERTSEIIAQKKAKFDAQKRTRRLH